MELFIMSPDDIPIKQDHSLKINQEHSFMADYPLNYRIRFAHPVDISGIIELMRPYNMHHIPSPEMGHLDYQLFIVAEYDDRLIGAAGYTFLSSDVGKTTLLAVHPDYKKKGIGLKLQAIRMQILRSLGCAKIITNADRPETIAWYKQNFGYREIGKLPKIHPFGLADVSEWTTLEADLTKVETLDPPQHEFLLRSDSMPADKETG